MRLRDKTLDHFEAGRARKDCTTRLELADFQLNRILFRLSNVGGILNDEVERFGCESVQQISLMKLDTRCQF
jgi:hypothetical protein